MSIGSAFGVQAMLIISGVIAARILGVDNRGNLALLWLLAAIPLALIPLGVPLAMTYYIALAPRTTRALLGSLRRSIAIQAVVLLGIHVTLIVAVFGDRSGDVRVAAIISLLATPAILALQYALAVLQGEGRIRAFSFYRVLSTASYGFLLIPLVVIGTHSLALVATCWVASLMITGVGAIAHVLTGLPPVTEIEPAELPTVGTVVGFGLRGLLGSAAPLEVLNLDQTIVGLFVSSHGLGLYVIGTALANLPQSVAIAIGYVAYPQIAGGRGRSAAATTVRFVLLTVVLTGALVIVMEVLAGSLVPIVYGRSFAGAVPVARVMLLSAVFIGARRVLGDCVRGLGYPSAATIAELASIVALLAFAAAFLGHGLIGVAIALTAASATGFAALVVAVLVIRRRRHAEAPAQ
ncbi:MAG: hypothetical protein ACR2IP_07115 [Solirubrobacteraceae bacterium]